MFFFVFLESKTFRFVLQTMNIYLESEFLVEFQLNAQPGTLVLASGISPLASVALETEAEHRLTAGSADLSDLEQCLHCS